MSRSTRRPLVSQYENTLRGASLVGRVGHTRLEAGDRGPHSVRPRRSDPQYPQEIRHGAQKARRSAAAEEPGELGRDKPGSQETDSRGGWPGSPLPRRSPRRHRRRPRQGNPCSGFIGGGRAGHGSAWTRPSMSRRASSAQGRSQYLSYPFNGQFNRQGTSSRLVPGLELLAKVITVSALFSIF